MYEDLDERGHCLRLGSPLTFFPNPPAPQPTELLMSNSGVISILHLPWMRGSPTKKALRSLVLRTAF